MIYKRNFKIDLQRRYDSLQEFTKGDKDALKLPITCFTGSLSGKFLKRKIQIFVGMFIKQITRYTESKTMKFEFKDSANMKPLRFDVVNEKFLNAETEEEKKMASLLLVAVDDIFQFRFEILESVIELKFDDVNNKMDDLIKKSEKESKEAEDFINKVKKEDEEKGDK